MRALLMIIFTVLWKDTWHLTLVIWMSSLSLWLDRTHGNVIKPKPVQGTLTMCVVICQWHLRCFQYHQNLLSDGLITDQTAWYRFQIIHSEIRTSNNPVKKTSCLPIGWRIKITNHQKPKISSWQFSWAKSRERLTMWVCRLSRLSRLCTAHHSWQGPLAQTSVCSQLEPGVKVTTAAFSYFSKNFPFFLSPPIWTMQQSVSCLPSISYLQLPPSPIRECNPPFFIEQPPHNSLRTPVPRWIDRRGVGFVGECQPKLKITN